MNDVPEKDDMSTLEALDALDQQQLADIVEASSSQDILRQASLMTAAER